jgi:hypothetical protein
MPHLTPIRLFSRHRTMAIFLPFMKKAGQLSEDWNFEHLSPERSSTFETPSRQLNSEIPYSLIFPASMAEYIKSPHCRICVARAGFESQKGNSLWYDVFYSRRRLAFFLGKGRCSGHSFTASFCHRSEPSLNVEMKGGIGLLLMLMPG